MIKELISPYREDAFTEKMLHKVVLSKIDFELPDIMWKEIEAGFACYWDVEVGIGNYVCLEDAYFSIQNHLRKRAFLFPNAMLWSIIEIMFDFIERIPGAFIDDTDDGGTDDEYNPDFDVALYLEFALLCDEYDENFDEEDDCKYEEKLKSLVPLPFLPKQRKCPF